MIRAAALAWSSALTIAVTGSAYGQTPPAPPLPSQQVSLACAPPPAFAATRAAAFRIIGAQDTAARSIFDERDLVLVNGGTRQGLQVGQRYFVRRRVNVPDYRGLGRAGHHSLHTAGWIRLVSANDAVSIALVEHACDAIHTGDYLEAFTPPTTVANESVIGNPADLDFTSTSKVLFGQDDREVISPGEFLFIDRGAGQGVEAGARFAIYRDVQTFRADTGVRRSAGLPLAAIGEAVVVSTGASTSVVQVIAARDAVQAGDYAVSRRR
jgi:hypothetical protein